MARRYHWRSAAVRDFVCEPHTGIVDRHTRPAQDAMLALVRQRPEQVLREVRHLRVPLRHDVRAEDVDLKRLGAVLAVAVRARVSRFRFAAAAREAGAADAPDAGAGGGGGARGDESVAVLRSALDAAKLGDTEKLDGFARLDRFVRSVGEWFTPEADFEKAVGHERAEP
jgi:uncharacterized protein